MPAPGPRNTTRPRRPPDELGRVRALNELHLLDTPAEERFDRITRLALRLLEAPIAVISLVDAEREWTKSSAGLPMPATVRDGSFGEAAIRDGQTLVVTDALADERFSSQPIVVGEPRIRFYAGHPLRAPGGQPVAVLAVMDQWPREPGEAEIEALADLARIAERELGRNVSGTDLLELRSLQDLVLRLSTLLNLTNNAVVVLDGAGTIHFWNKPATEVYGRQRHESVGHPVDQAIVTESETTVPEILAAVREKGAWEGELLHCGADGTQRLMASHWRLMRDPVQPTSWIVHIAQDVTAARQREQLLASHARLLDVASDTIFVRDMDGVISFWNQGAEAALGYSRTEAVGKVWHQLLESMLPASVEEIEVDLLADGHWEGLVTHRAASGREVRVSGRWVLVRDANGKPDSVLHLAHDITELSTALEELRALEERQRVILDHSPDAVLLYLPDGTLLHANHIAHEMFDLHDGVLTRGLANLSPDSMAGAIAAQTAEQQRSGPVQGELRMNRRDGTTFLAEYTSAEISGPGGVPTIVTYIRDITQRKLVEEELRASEERHRAVLENSFDAVFLTKGRGEFVHVNRAACELFGTTAKELMRSSASALLEPDTPGLPEFREMRKQTGRARGELIMIRPDGSRFPAELTSSRFVAGDGTVYISTFLRDLTERKRAEAALQASERRFRSIFNQAPVGIAQIAADGRLYDLNPRFCSMLGVSAEQAIGARFDRFVPSENQAGLIADFETATQDPTREVRTVTQEVLRGDRTRVWLQATSAPVRRSDGTLDHILVMLEDVTAKRAAEASAMATLAELERLNKMKSEFISVVSHEFRTALAGIQGFSELIRDEDLGKGEMKEFAGDINKDALRLNRMITDMLDLDRIEAGRLSLRLSNVDLNTAIGETIERARATSSIHRIVADLDPALPTVLADGDRLVQVLSNLLNNAVKYSPAGGEIRVLSRLDGTQVLISVSDQGQGIPQEFITRIFERYERYEASPASRIIGTGLGLPIARQIVEMHGGRIWVDSTAGAGSTFHFTIPVRKL